jgi:3-hydroxyisobutyrate dehydrogenase-like beta-hydroxyacid dehydrogenase
MLIALDFNRLTQIKLSAGIESNRVASLCMKTVAFLGIGLMGSLMSANVARGGFRLRTYDPKGRGNCRSAAEAAALRKARPLLATMGTEIFHTGAPGSGHATKALNNYLGAAGTIAGMEALLIGEKFGLNPGTLIAVINASTGKNSTTERKIPQQVFTKAFASGFTAALMTKHVGIAAGLARSLNLEAPYLGQTLKVWRAALGRLPAGADHTEIYRYLRALRRTRRREPSRASIRAPSRSPARTRRAR